MKKNACVSCNCILNLFGALIKLQFSSEATEYFLHGCISPPSGEVVDYYGFMDYLYFLWTLFSIEICNEKSNSLRMMVLRWDLCP